MSAALNLILGHTFGKALIDAGVISLEDCVRRVVIDAPADGVVVMYVERFGDERLLQVATTLQGVEIRGVPAPEADE